MTSRLLLDELRQHATHELEDARRAATEEAAQIREAAHDAAARAASTAHAEQARKATQTESVARADALRRMSQRLLPARAAALQRVFTRAASQIELRSAHPDIADAIAALVHEAVGYLPSGPVHARCAPALRDAVTGALARAGRSEVVVVADPSVPLGAIVESGDGKISVDATFSRLLARERAVLATELARLLAGDSA